AGRAMMTEYEVQTLMLASRAEFDIGTVLYLVTSIAFMLLLSSRRLTHEPAQVRLLSWSYVLVSVFILVRVIAAMVRFGKLNQVLDTLHPAFVVDNHVVQIPTLVLRVTLFILLPFLTLSYARPSSREPKTPNLTAPPGP